MVKAFVILGLLTITTVGTTISSQPLTTAAPRCGTTPRCTWSADMPVSWYWTPVSFNTTVTAATVIEVVNTVLNTTRTTTVQNDITLSKGISQFHDRKTNAAGTHVETVTIKGSPVVLAYPTAYINWPESYSWNGTLSTRLPGASTSSCIVVGFTSTTVSLSALPQPSPSFPKPGQNGPDPQGLLFDVTYAGMGATPIKSAYPLDLAIQTCSVSVAFPAIAALTARFMTISAVQFEDNPEETPAPKKPETPPSKSPTSVQASPVVKPTPASPAPVHSSPAAKATPVDKPSSAISPPVENKPPTPSIVQATKPLTSTVIQPSSSPSEQPVSVAPQSSSRNDGDTLSSAPERIGTPPPESPDIGTTTMKPSSSLGDDASSGISSSFPPLQTVNAAGGIRIPLKGVVLLSLMIMLMVS